MAQQPLLTRLPIIAEFIRNLKREVTTKGWPVGISHLLKEYGINLNITPPSAATTQTLAQKPVLVVANHPYELEVLVLIGSLPNRNNVKLIINANYLNLIDYGHDQMIPVYIGHKNHNQYAQSFIKRALNLLAPKNNLSAEDEHSKNIESIAQAAKFLSGGQLVILFPDRHSPDGHWFNGIGHLIHQTKPEINPQIVFSFIEGTSSKDFRRFIKPINRFFPPINVTFSEPISLAPYIDLEPKDIRVQLEAQYREWVSSIGKFYPPASD